MKIYDKTLKQIFDEMIWQYKVIFIVGVLFLTFVIIYVPYKMFTFKALKKDIPAPINIYSSTSSILTSLDPSLAGDGKNVYLTTTTTKLSSDNERILFYPIIASSDENCKKWRSSAKPILSSNIEEVIGPDNRTPLGTGIWRIETPSIVYDPKDVNAPWKVYAHKYFWMKGKALAQLYSMIVMTSAKDPEGAWTTEKWVFATNETSPPTPYNDLIPIKLNTLHPSLKNVKSYARPSVVHVDDHLVMTLSAYIPGRDTPDRVIMIASADHGKTWRYLGTPFSHKDVGSFENMQHISGASLIKEKGEVFLTLVLGNDTIDGQGTFIFSFDNFSEGGLKRDTKTNAPLPKSKLPLFSGAVNRIGGGFAAFSDDCKGGGIITSEFSGIRNAYTLFQTHKRPSSPKD